MLVVNGVSKRYGHQTILVDIHFTINPGECVGLIGPNGCGKTTLMRIITGEEQPDEGSISYMKKDLRIGYLKQVLDLSSIRSIGEFLQPYSTQIEQVETELAHVSHLMGAAEGEDYRQFEEQYDVLLQE
jgi:ATP-binding cassette subfamily F protein 3